MGSRKVVIHYYLHSGASNNKTHYDKTRIKNLSGGDERSQTHTNSLTMEGNNMTVQAKLNDVAHVSLRDWAKETVKTDLNKLKRVDALRSAGWVSTMCISPKSAGSTATERSWTFAKNAINSGFPQKAQELMAKSAKAAGDATVNGQPRAYWMRQANAVLGDIKKQLEIRERIAAEVEAGKAGPDATTRTPEMMVRDALEECVKRIQKAETFEFDHQKFTLDEFIAYLNMFIKSIG